MTDPKQWTQMETHFFKNCLFGHADQILDPKKDNAIKFGCHKLALCRQLNVILFQTMWFSSNVRMSRTELCIFELSNMFSSQQPT